jgi:glyoxylase-like metal-dependent hydrolase (beta-lactamase superfamily II)
VTIVAVVPGVFRMDLAMVNAYLCEDDDGLTLVDCGLATSAVDLRDAIEQAGHRYEELQRIILTHYDDDHRGAAHALRSEPRPQILAHSADAPVIRGLEPQAEPDLTARERPIHAQIVPNVVPAPSCEVDVELFDGSIVDALGGAVIVGVPGHTPGSIALYVPDRGIVFTGDAAASIGGAPVVGFFNIDRAQAKRSFARLASLDFEVACVGHGDPITSKAAPQFRDVAEGLRVAP